MVLAVLLAASLAANVALWRRVATLQRTVNLHRSRLKDAGRRAGKAQAESDFRAGAPRWYQVGDFARGVPKDKPGRRYATVGCLVTEYESAFVESYNKTMDQLQAGQDGRGAQ
jgi:hypothetical protein